MKKEFGPIFTLPHFGKEIIFKHNLAYKNFEIMGTVRVNNAKQVLGNKC